MNCRIDKYIVGFNLSVTDMDIMWLKPFTYILLYS